jgi:hypothetical protein
MSLFRTATMVTACAVCGLGYAASQFAYWAGGWARYARAVEESALPTLASVLLAALVALAVLDREEP